MASMAAGSGESSSMSTKKNNKRNHKRKREEEVELMDSLPWSTSIPIGEDEDGETFSTLFAGSAELDGGFLSLEEIDEADYNLAAFPTVESGKTEKGLKSKKQARENNDGNKEAVDEVVEGEQETEDEEEEGKSKDDLKSRKIEENKTKRKKKKKEKKKKAKEAEKDQDEEAVDEIVKGKQEKEDEEEEGEERKGKDGLKSRKIEEKKTKEKKKKAKEAKKDQASSAVSCDEDNKPEELDGEQEIPPEFSAWSLMRLHPLLMKSIYHLGFKEPTEIQKACFSVAAFQGKDVIGAAETGSGKTLAFGLPILQRLLDEREKLGKLYALKGEEAKKYSADGYLRALIITPTRELALQVTDHLKNAAKNLGVRVVPIVGGMSSAKQERLLKGKPEIVVGTPGRLWELMSAGEKHLVELHSLSFFVLDEADRMVESGHFRELQSIIDLLPVADKPNEGKMQTAQSGDIVSDAPKKKRQTFVFSATIALSSDFRKKLKRGSSKKQSSSGEVNSIEVLSERAGIRENVAIIDLTTASILAPKIEESFIKCEEEEKDAYLYYILSVHGQGRTIVFCTSVAALRHICALLKILGIDVCKLYSDMKQRARLKAIDRFRASENGILVATDVAARGIDIKNVRTVIHYQLPHSAEVYVHRSGRTARAFEDGCSIALIAPNDTSKFYSLCKSFSKESVKIFPLDNSYMPAVRKRLSLARQIDQIERKGSRERVDRTWLEKHAELMELELDEEESEEERVDNVRQRKATSAQVKKLQEELSSLLSRPMQPKKFSDRYFAGRGMSPLLQNQLAELTNQKQQQMQTGGDKKRRKLVVVAQNCIEPLQALRDGGKEVMNMKGQSADKRRDIANLRKKRKEEKIGRRDQRRDQKKKRKLMASS
ncbi:DEAD-box ATP-dependent RNA helicase 13 isoform X2 [Eutrema salsugineum]|uniref:DEAD-box ATP-dependent RNA helicase 13 isoform X2 n=1 Tax=Eutrema salsugineum TaxID=72664 RepID=UPI000CED7EA8|nr:DEAD-box ATP-dependent RNA helicase 13 isoform X2 [Eutrema salsugineum]